MATIRSSKPREWRRAPVLIVVAALALTAPSTLIAAENSTAAESTFTLRVRSDYRTLDWQTLATPDVLLPSLPVYERLVAYNSANKLVPYLAKSWKVSPASRPKEIVFVLRKGAKCEDGHVLTPLDVLRSFDRFIKVPKISDQLSRYYGAGPYHISANNQKGTFTFRTETPYANLAHGFAIAGGIICPAGFRALVDDPLALQKRTYGSGPYHVVSAIPGDRIDFEKRLEWTWGPGGSTPISKLPQHLTYRLVGDETTAANLLITGDADLGQISGPDTVRLSSSSSLVHKTLQNYHFYPLVFNQNAGRILRDRPIREALMAAVNATSFAQAVWQGRATVSPSILTPTDPCYDRQLSRFVVTGGTSRARQILQAAGYQPDNSGVMAKDGKQLRLTLLTSPDLIGAGGDYLSGVFRDVGILIDHQSLSSTALSVQFVQQNWDVAVSVAFAFAPIRGANFSVWYGAPPPRGSNYGLVGGGDNDYNRAALIALQRTDCKPWITLQETILKQRVMLPLAKPLVDVFGSKKWDFPGNVAALEVEYLKPRP